MIETRFILGIIFLVWYVYVFYSHEWLIVQANLSGGMGMLWETDES